MRLVGALLLLLAVALARADRILLIPLDSRPAAGQFAQMIGKIANVDVRMPPYEALGRFTTPGSPERVLDWLESQDLSQVSSVIVSSDMVCYGGLIASRLNDVTATEARARLDRLVRICKSSPTTKLYIFSATMRLTPTATKGASKFRLQLAQYEEAKTKASYTGSSDAARLAAKLKPLIPASEIAGYEATRTRNNVVQRDLIWMLARHDYNYLVIGQDDARPYGPHVPETAALRELVAKVGVASDVYFCEGIDQHSNVLLSRALLAESNWTPHVRVVYSDELGKYKYASFESKPIKDSLNDQLLASGAKPMGPDGNYDYTLYLNTPGRREFKFQEFLTELKQDVDQGFPVAIADIDLGHDGTADPELFSGMWENARMMKLLAFAGWNTAGNTMGTAIPAANVYLLARRTAVDPLLREVAQREFLLHRFVNDYAYHKFTRPEAYKMIESIPGANHDETYGRALSDVQDFVARDLKKHLMQFFDDQFLGRTFFAGTGQYVFTGIDDIKIWLPWPRPYEVRLEFHLLAKPGGASGH